MTAVTFDLLEKQLIFLATSLRSFVIYLHFLLHPDYISTHLHMEFFMQLHIHTHTHTHSNTHTTHTHTQHTHTHKHSITHLSTHMSLHQGACGSSQESYHATRGQLVPGPRWGGPTASTHTLHPTICLSIY